MNKPIVKIVDLSHKYSKYWALKDVSFEINQNEIIGLLGSNGAGKSTTLNILCGVIEPLKGIVEINGVNIRKRPVKAKEFIGFLPQKAPLYNELKVKEYLNYAGLLRGIHYREIKTSVGLAMEKCGISSFSNRLIGNLSGGYQQRVGIAQAIIHNPKLVVLDEPTNGLDPVQIREVRKLIKEIGQNHSVIVSTHILPEVEAMCSKVNMIEGGKLVFSGLIDEFKSYSRPISIVAEFLNEPDTSKLKSIEFVQNVESISGLKYRFEVSEGKEITQSIIKFCVEQDISLYQIYIEKSTLEDVFAKISESKVRKLA